MQREVYTVALAGNPNVGKSTVFNALTGMRQHTGNWPGKTVETARGRFSTDAREYLLVDLPGTYSLSAHSEEERVARDFLLSGDYDAAVVVCDATCLQRSLQLALQVLELTPNVILCVNLMDEARQRGIAVDITTLSKELGIPVVGAAAQKKRTLRDLKAALDAFQPRKMPQLPPPETGLAVRLRTEKAAELCARAVRAGKHTDARDRALDRVLTGRVTGWAVMVLLLALVLWLTISGANIVSDALGGTGRAAARWPECPRRAGVAARGARGRDVPGAGVGGLRHAAADGDLLSAFYAAGGLGVSPACGVCAG